MSKDVQDDLKLAICKIFSVFPEELEYNLPGGIGTKKMEDLLALINSQALELLDRLEDKSERMRETRILDAPEVRAIPLSAIQEETKRYMGEL